MMYCDYKDTPSPSIEDVLGTLLVQIFAQIGRVPAEVQHECKSCSSPPFWSRPRRSTLITWLKSISEQVRLYLFVDALDEHDHGHELFQLLQDVSSADGQSAVMVSSRPSLDVQVRHKISTLRLESFIHEVDADINRYVLARLRADIKLKRWSQGRYISLISDELVRKSKGMFRWASCQLDAISRVRTPKDMRRALQSLPTGLEETYKRILYATTCEDTEILRKMLRWLSFSTKKLTHQELLEAIAIQPYAPHIDEDSRLVSLEDLLHIGNNMIRLIDGDRVILAHLSVRDFLVSRALETSDTRAAYFSLVPPRSHAELAADCLTYLLFTELQAGPCKSSDDYMQRLRKLPLLKYAANAWAYHFKAADVDQTLSTVALTLFLPESPLAFMSWIQVIHTGTDSNFKWNVYPSHATGLYYAASFGLLDIVRYIMDMECYRIDLDAPGSRFGGTALHAAAIREHFDVMRVLLNAGANPSKGDFDNVTPLHSLASQGCVEGCKILLEFGAETHVRDLMSHETPLEWARNSGRLSVALLLESAGSKFQKSESFLSSGSLSSWPAQSTPDESTTSSSSSEAHGFQSKILETGELTVWKPVPSFFPDHYEKRSGLSGSTLLGFTIGNTVTLLQPATGYDLCLEGGIEVIANW